MAKVVLIACCKEKLDHKAKASDMYISALFKKCLAYAHLLKPDAIYILSARYHLLDLNEMIEPYNLSLNSMQVDKIRQWAEIVLDQLREHADLQQDHFIFLAGEKYRRFLIPDICDYEIAMQGKSIGQQLHCLNEKLKEGNA